MPISALACVSNEYQNNESELVNPFGAISIDHPSEDHHDEDHMKSASKQSIISKITTQTHHHDEDHDTKIHSNQH